MGIKRKKEVCVYEGLEPFMSITIGDGGMVARGTEPDSELLTRWLGATCTLLPSILWLMV